MHTLATNASWLVAGASLFLAIAVLLTTAQLMVALPVLLDMLMAAGLLRLGADAPWPAIVAAGAIVVLRKVVTAGLRQTPSRPTLSGRLGGSPTEPGGHPAP